ncbi:MAG: hypothetical protein CME64_08310 [Halobacteriovoraceae bacterium]|nr:hypothetical protein [Halobacteriovoraceae bacterium]|tara:strand:- start:207307 stop:207597 length:291 start_codon:yes stop_codon:yes gene_type:complete
MKKNEKEELALIFKTLSNPIRLTMLEHIATCENSCHKHNISELAKLCEVDFSVVSRHLKALKDANILSSTKHKNDVLYTVSSTILKRRLESFLKLF